MSPLVRRAIASLAALIAIGSSARALACAACGCGDPSVSEIGIPDATAGGGLAGISSDARLERTGHDHTTQERLSLVALWMANPSVRLYAKAPLVRRERVGIKNRYDQTSGVGDLELGGNLVLFRTMGFSQGQSVTAQFEIDLPTGDHRGLDLDMMTGSGATTVEAGFGWFFHRRAWRAYASAAGRRSLATARDGYLPGDAILGNLGVQSPLTKNHFDWTAELNLRDARPDRWPGEPVPDTGGTALFATPGVLASFGTATHWYARGSVQIPIAWDVYGSQRPGPVLQAGLFRSF